ncbi:hypothetical protein B296_00020988, partial [Ensete ventricosum]
ASRAFPVPPWIEKHIDVIISGPASNEDSVLGKKAYARAVVEKHPKRKNKLKIAFEAGETEYFDHNDALVVSVSISNARVKRVMIDIGSSANVLYFDTLQKLGLTTTDLSPMSSTLTVSTGGSIAPLGMTILLVTIRQEPKSKTMMVTFMVVNLLSTYNTILGRHDPQ